MGVANFSLGQSIGINENNKSLSIFMDESNAIHLKFLLNHQNCRIHSFGRLVGV